MGSKKDQKRKEIINGFYSDVEEYLSGLSDDEKRALFFDTCCHVIDNASSDYVTNNIKLVFKKFKNADDNERGKIVIAILRTVMSEAPSVLHKLKRMKCEVDGHKFGPWKEIRTTKEKYYDRSEFHTEDSALYGTYGKIETEEVLWRKWCKVCGTWEDSYTKPESVIKAERRKKL